MTRRHWIPLAAAMSLGWLGWAPGGHPASAETTTTSSTTRHETHTRLDVADVHVYQTRVLGFVSSDGSAGHHEAFVFDQTVPHAPSSAEAASAFAAAADAVGAALRDPGILPGHCATREVSAPALTASSTRSDTAMVGTQLDHTEVFVTTTMTTGPAVILVGEDQSQTHFVPAGTVNVNTNTHTESFIDDLFETTFTHASTYEVVGHKSVRPSVLDAAGAPAARQVRGPAALSGARGAPVPLFAAVLPGGRSVTVGCPATAFVTLINAGAEPAAGVGIALADPDLPAVLVYQTTDPASNALTGNANTPIDIPAGQAQTFLVAVTPTGPLSPRDVALAFAGGNTAPVSPLVGLNTLLLSGSLSDTPDVVALGATLNNDGIVDIPGLTGTGFFSVATVNVGAAGLITFSADTGGVPLPIDLSVCQTDPATGVCLEPPRPSVTIPLASGATPTFAVFATGTGFLLFDPATHRVFARVTDAGGAVRGATSVAPRTR